MKDLKYDKVFVISYVKNIEKQNTMRNYLNDLFKIDFEFIYGTDMYDIPNINLIKLDNCDKYENNKKSSYYIHQIAATISHLTAIQESYFNESINSVLIFEDDIVLYKDLDYIKNGLYSEFPNDADIVQYGFHSEYIPVEIKNNFEKMKINKIGWCPGSICYGICNRNAMKHIIDFQKTRFTVCDYYTLYDGLNVYGYYPQLFIDRASPDDNHWYDHSY